MSGAGRPAGIVHVGNTGSVHTDNNNSVNAAITSSVHAGITGDHISAYGRWYYRRCAENFILKQNCIGFLINTNITTITISKAHFDTIWETYLIKTGLSIYLIKTRLSIYKITSICGCRCHIYLIKTRLSIYKNLDYGPWLSLIGSSCRCCCRCHHPPPPPCPPPFPWHNPPLYHHQHHCNTLQFVTREVDPTKIRNLVNCYLFIISSHLQYIIYNHVCKNHCLTTFKRSIGLTS